MNETRDATPLGGTFFSSRSFFAHGLVPSSSSVSSSLASSSSPYRANHHQAPVLIGCNEELVGLGAKAKQRHFLLFPVAQGRHHLAGLLAEPRQEGSVLRRGLLWYGMHG